MQRYRGRKRWRFALLSALWLSVGCAAEAPSPLADANLVMIVVDTLRADHLGVYGYGRPTSPNFDALAADATVYTDATAQSSWTRPSVASLFTSRLPSEHGAVAAGARLDEGVATLAELLRDAGYRTVGVSANFVHVSRNSGLARGFDHFWAEPIQDERAEQAPLYRLGDLPLRAPTASELNERVAELLPTAAGTPVFLYVHYMDAHDYQERRDAYAEGVMKVDVGVGELLATLETQGLIDGSVVILSSDHGERIGEEHLLEGRLEHFGEPSFEEVLRVPLIIAPPRFDDPELLVRSQDLFDIVARIGGAETVQLITVCEVGEHFH